VLVYDRSAGGALTPAGSYPTGGKGSGGGLGSQGSLILAAHGHRLFAVNAASNSVTEFKVDNDRLKWVATVPSGGSTPISLTYRKHVLYVLNAGGAGNIAGFRQRGEILTRSPARRSRSVPAAPAPRRSRSRPTATSSS